MVSDIPNQVPRSVRVTNLVKVSPPSLPSCWNYSSMATIGSSNVPFIIRPGFALEICAPITVDSVVITPSFELVPLRTPEGLILYLKHLESPWLIRVIPVRDPDQPRLWCLRMEACAGASLTAKTARVDPFYTALAMTREQLTETLASIRLGVGGWLLEQPQGDLRRWLARITRMPIPGDFAPPEPPPRVSRHAPSSSAALTEASSELLRKAH